jgi:hypothetical protein
MLSAAAQKDKRAKAFRDRLRTGSLTTAAPAITTHSTSPSPSPSLNTTPTAGDPSLAPALTSSVTAQAASAPAVAPSPQPKVQQLPPVDPPNPFSYISPWNDSHTPDDDSKDVHSSWVDQMVGEDQDGEEADESLKREEAREKALAADLLVLRGETQLMTSFREEHPAVERAREVVEEVLGPGGTKGGDGGIKVPILLELLSITRAYEILGLSGTESNEEVTDALANLVGLFPSCDGSKLTSRRAPQMEDIHQNQDQTKKKQGDTMSLMSAHFAILSARPYSDSFDYVAYYDSNLQLELSKYATEVLRVPKTHIDGFWKTTDSSLSHLQSLAQLSHAEEFTSLKTRLKDAEARADAAEKQLAEVPSRKAVILLEDLKKLKELKNAQDSKMKEVERTRDRWMKEEEKSRARLDEAEARIKELEEQGEYHVHLRCSVFPSSSLRILSGI